MQWSEVIYQYDQSFDGFLCCVYESYVNKEFPIGFCGDEAYVSLYPVRCVTTQRPHAQRVWKSLVKRSASASSVVRRGFLTCLEEKETYLYAFIQKLYEQGDSFLQNQSDAVYHPLVKAIRHMNGELEKLRGFVRFSDYNGILGAEIDPKNQVLPLLRGHFCNRYAEDSFFLYDRTHRDLLLYTNGCSRIIHVDRLQLDLPGEDEMCYRALWKRFHETISIQERKNIRCQNTFLPKRYRGAMTEFLPCDYEAQRQKLNPEGFSEAFPDSAAPDAIPAPVTRR